VKAAVHTQNGASPSPAERLDFLRRCRAEVDAIEVGPIDNFWSRYYSDFHRGNVPDVVPNDSWTLKNRHVFELIDRLKPKTVLDLGSNTGWYSKLAESLGCGVIAAEKDEMCVENIYAEARARNSRILPIVFDFRSPTPGVGPCNRWLLPATDRLGCDLVLALALVHHLVEKQSLTFPQIAETLSSFSKRWLLVEFMPPEDEWVRDWLTPELSWYTLDRFEASLRKHFSSVELLDSYPAPRKLLLCEK
jgi:hypothetical protein